MKENERTVHELQRELAEIEKKWELLRLQPCKGDLEIRAKEKELDALDERQKILQKKIRELDKKQREESSEVLKKTPYESPLN